MTLCYSFSLLLPLTVNHCAVCHLAFTFIRYNNKRISSWVGYAILVHVIDAENVSGWRPRTLLILTVA